MEYRDYYMACEYLESLGKLASPLRNLREHNPQGLNSYVLRAQDLLNRVGNPQKDMNIVHVTGTSGKGTAVALIHHLLQQSGYVVGSTISPATTTTLERIRVNDLYIDPQTFADIVEELKPAIEDMYLHGTYGRPSYFDCLLATSLLYFKRMKCQWVVLEVAMGGRYDATNAIPSPEISVITNVGMDHMHLLGDTKEAIAHEKAGVIKPNSHFFTTETDTKLLDYFKEVCVEQGVFFHMVEGSNRELVLAIAQHLNLNTNVSFDSVSLPCRFETVETSPRIILDGAHNGDKVGYTMGRVTLNDTAKLHVIFGAGKTKDALGMLDIIAEQADSIALCPVTNNRTGSFPVKEMYEYISENYPHIPVEVFLNSFDALSSVKETAHIDDTILVTGSLYLTGALRTLWYPETYILQNRKSF